MVPSESSFSNIGQAFSDDFANHNTEAQRQFAAQTAGTFSGLSSRVITNTLSTATLTIRFRVNTANGNGVLSITAGQTGWFTDGSNTDTISAGNTVGINSVVAAGGTGSAEIMFITTNFAAGSGHSIYLTSDVNNVGFATDSVTRFLQLSYGGGGEGSTEANVQIVARAAGTLEDFSVRINANARTTTTTFRTRKNGANGGQSVSVTSGATGNFQDTSNTDTIASGDTYNASFTTSTGGGAMDWGLVGVTFTSTGSNNDIFWQGNTGAISAGSTPFFPLASYGGFPLITTEANAQVDHNFAGTASKLRVFCDANTSTTAAALKFRKNAADGSQSVSITALTTGVFEDASNSDSFVATDDCCTQVSNITVGSVQFKWIAITEAVQTVITRDLSDAVSIIERFTRAWTAPRSRSENISIGESTTRTWNAPRSPIDIVTITESTSSIKGRIIELLETMGIIDTVSRTVSWTRSFTDTVTITEIFVRITEIIITDLVAITDSFSRAWSLSRSLLDLSTIIEYVRLPLNWLKRTKPTTLWTPRTKP